MVLQAMERADVPATGFFVTDQANNHPDLLKRFAGQGELALNSNSPELLVGLPESLQRDRLEIGTRVLKKLGSNRTMACMHGWILRLGNASGGCRCRLRYLLVNERTQSSPSRVPWEDILDYRDSLLTTVRHDPLASAYSFSPQDTASPPI